MNKDYIIFSTKTPIGEKVDKIVCELKGDDWKLFKLIGKAIGTDLGHCVYLGNRRAENFWERVCGYRIIEDEECQKLEQATGQKYISVQFFEKKDSCVEEEQKEPIDF